MVMNIYMKCDVCEAVINLKWQVGHVEEAPVSIVCPDCLTVIKIILYTDNKEVKIDFKSKNASQTNKGISKYIAETSSELLTYKIANQNAIVPGNTPFMRSISMIGHENYHKYHQQFINAIYAHRDNNHIFERINDLYLNNNFNHLCNELSKQLRIDFKANSKEEIIRNLYKYNINYFSIFLHNSDFGNLNAEILDKMKLLKTNKEVPFKNFLENYCKDDILISYDKKLYRAISNILTNYYYFIPATFLKYVSKENFEYIFNEYTLTTTNFSDVKDIYISIYENLIDVYEIILLLNNVLIRNNYLSMPSEIKINKENINTLEKYRRLTKAHKLRFIDYDEGFNKFMPNFERKIRNAIGHEDWNYIPFDHKVQYGDDEIYILEYVYKCWNMFEKIIAIYKILQDIKINREILVNTSI